MATGDTPEQTAHSVEEVGWVHHMWDEQGGNLVSGVCMIVGMVLVAWIGLKVKRKWSRR